MQTDGFVACEFMLSIFNPKHKNFTTNCQPKQPVNKYYDNYYHYYTNANVITFKPRDFHCFILYHLNNEERMLERMTTTSVYGPKSFL